MVPAALRAIASWNEALVSDYETNTHTEQTNTRGGGVARSRVGDATVATNPQILEPVDTRVGIGDRLLDVCTDTSGSL